MILVNDRRVSWIKHIKEEVNWWMEDAVSPARAVYTSPISSLAVYMQQTEQDPLRCTLMAALRQFKVNNNSCVSHTEVTVPESSY